MDATQEKLFLELRQTQEEIVQSLKRKDKQEWMKSILEDELKDIQSALSKLKSGSFGHCEFSGEPLPGDLLQLIPTMKSTKDTETLEHFYRKPIDSSFF